MFELLDHTADVAVRLVAPGAKELLQEAARALLAILLAPESGPVAPKEALPLEMEAEDGEALLVDFLNELIFLFDARRFLVARVDVAEARLEPPARLSARLWGETYDASKHAAKTEVKAATFHGMRIAPTARGLEVDVVFDL